MPIHNTHVHTGDSAHCRLSVRKFAGQRIRELSIKFRHFRSIKLCLEIADTMNLGSGVLAKGVELSALTDPCNFPSPSSEAVPPSSAPIWRSSPLLEFPTKYRRKERPAEVASAVVMSGRTHQANRHCIPMNSKIPGWKFCMRGRQPPMTRSWIV